MAKRKYTADEALELIFADNDSAEDFGSSSEDDVSSENENILEQSDQYCNIVKRLEFEKRADTNVVHVMTVLVFVLRAFVILTRNNTQLITYSENGFLIIDVLFLTCST